MLKSCTTVCFVLVVELAGVPRLNDELHTFTRIQLSDQFWSEGATFGDLNNDGVNDIVSGPWWWEGPDFAMRHESAVLYWFRIVRNADRSVDFVPYLIDDESGSTTSPASARR